MVDIVNKVSWSGIVSFKKNNSLIPSTENNNNNNFQMSLLVLDWELDILLWDRAAPLCALSR